MHESNSSSNRQKSMSTSQSERRFSAAKLREDPDDVDLPLHDHLKILNKHLIKLKASDFSADDVDQEMKEELLKNMRLVQVRLQGPFKLNNNP